MSTLNIERAGAIVLLVLLMRLAYRVWVLRRKYFALTAPLADRRVVRDALAPGRNDDRDMLDELRDTILHLNRRAYAEEFVALPAQIVTLYDRVGETQQATLRRAVVRLIESGDNWLIVLGAKTASALSVTEARPALCAVIDASSLNAPLRAELERAIAVIPAAQAAPPLSSTRCDRLRRP
jgi:hypothetical protein